MKVAAAVLLFPLTGAMDGAKIASRQVGPSAISIAATALAIAMSAIAPPNSAARGNNARSQQATSQACPDMNEAASRGGLHDDRCAGRSERCRTTLQHPELATLEPTST